MTFLPSFVFSTTNIQGFFKVQKKRAELVDTEGIFLNGKT